MQNADALELIDDLLAKAHSMITALDHAREDVRKTAPEPKPKLAMLYTQLTLDMIIDPKIAPSQICPILAIS